MFICKNCGSNMHFDPQTQKLTCSHCGTAVSPHEYKESRALYAEESSMGEEDFSSTYQATLMTCPQCGGQLLTTDETAATFCSFCGSSVLLEQRVSNERRPDYIIPFQKTKEDCKKAYRRALKKAIYAPSNMSKEEQVDRFRGIYMPYWVYSFDKKGQFETLGKKEHRRGDYIYTKNYRLTSQIDASYEGLSFDASSSFSDHLSEAIAPFEFSQTTSFEPAYLSGFYADTHDVESFIYTEDARKIARKHAVKQLSHSRTFGKYNASLKDIPFHTGQPQLAMYPVWFLSCRNKKGDRISYAVVNGQTGKVAADLPIDSKKMFLGTLLLAIPIFLLLNLLLTLTPTKVLIATMILGIIGMFLASRQMDLIYRFENSLDDKGYLYLKVPGKSDASIKARAQRSAAGGFLLRIILTPILIITVLMFFFLGISLMGSLNVSSQVSIPIIAIMIFFFSSTWTSGKKERKNRKEAAASVRASKKEKMKILWKPITGIAASLIITALAPVSDLYYYGAAIVAMVFVAWSFWDILRLHNRLTTRPLPQFNTRGGD